MHKQMSTKEVRQAFLDFFASKQHQVVNSSTLVPGNDATLLFTNAGMVQFKDVFLGGEKRPYSRAATAQRCLRAGGKHNDLENVGYTARHHTFFEMLGNFSFGDYFKQDAIAYAWEFLTQVLGLPKEKLLVTVYATDDEAYDIWLSKVGVPAERIVRIGDNKGAPYASDNFWSMGDTGPCGPCTEIFYDHGDHIWGGPPGSAEEDGDRFIEIWNIVFMQFNRHADGKMDPLPKPSVDTGMGIERIAAIMQHVHSNYEIDIFQALVAKAAAVTGAVDLTDKSLRVLADHIRSCSFLIADGVMPSNEGRGYVLRRIIRRAIRHGNKLGAKGTFFFEMVATLVAQMGEAYPELVAQQAIIEKVLKLEEEQFGKTLERGLSILEDALAALTDKVIPGDVVFKLYDTYGFPADLTADVARERGLTIDEAGFQAAMEAQRKQSQQASNFGTDYNQALKSSHHSVFEGYSRTDYRATVVELFQDGQSVNTASGKVVVVLDHSPFYAESGGQVGDAGVIEFQGGVVRVTDTQKLGNAIAHHGEVEGQIGVNQAVVAKVDVARRDAIRKNHSATHLLHAALRQVLGSHVQQKGSLVGPERLRFDFAHFEGVSKAQLQEIEQLVNDQVLANHPLDTELMDLEAAKAKGAMALFGEKYDDEVRVVSMGGFSTELCGGTHVTRTGDIGLIKVVSEAGIAAGVRRIEAVTGAGALQFVQTLSQGLDKIAGIVKSDAASVADKVVQLAERNRQLEKDLAALKDKLASMAGAGLVNQVKAINGVQTLVVNLENTDGKALRGMMDELKNKLQSAVILLAAAEDGKVSLTAGVTNDLTAKVKAGELVNFVAQQVGGKGGGRPDMAQAGGTDVAALPGALQSVESWLTERL